MISLAGVGKYYGERAVLKNISLSVSAASVTLLAGPNGAGKTTLLRLMAGLIRPDHGSIEHSCGREGIGFLGHQPFLYAGLSALENLRFWQKLHNIPGGEQACLEQLKSVELERFATERAGTFSRGMAQRLNLARLFLLKPGLLLLDEPETGLDARSRALLHARIGQAAESGCAIVWITHGTAEEGARADRLIALERGRIAYDGPLAGYARSGAEAAC